MANVRPFERASRNPENPDFSTSELLRQVAPEAKPAPAPKLEPVPKLDEITTASTAPTMVIKHSRLSVYLTPEEHWLVRDKAHARRMSLNDYVRAVLLATES